MRRDILVVDNFLENPDAVREYALQQKFEMFGGKNWPGVCLLYTSPSPRDATLSRMPSSA